MLEESDSVADREIILYLNFHQSLLETRPDAALAVLRDGRDREWLRGSEIAAPVRLLEGLALERAGRDDEARGAYEEAVRVLEEALRRTPEDFRLPGPLGMAYAGLGRRAQAIAAAERGVAMIPLEKDSMNGSVRVWELAQVHARVGDPESRSIC